jgi:hypothetical protein
MEKATSSSSSSVLSSTKEALGNAFEALDTNKFFDEKIYGNLLKIDKRVVEKKKKVLMASFPLICNAVTWLLTRGVYAEERESIGYKSTYERASCLGDWEEMLNENPHLWPKREVFSYLLELKNLLTTVDTATGSSLTLDEIGRFAEWTESEKILLPSKGGATHKFTCKLVEVFPYLCVLLVQSKLLVAEIASPPYYWQIDVATNAPKLEAGTGIELPGFDGFIKEFAKEQVVKCYLSKIGLIEHTISLTTAITAGSRLVDGATAKRFLKVLTSKSEITERVLGKATVDELRELEKSQGEIFSQKSFSELTDEEKAKMQTKVQAKIEEGAVKKD